MENWERETALVRNLLVAYLPWNGWNVDDAVVVSGLGIGLSNRVARTNSA